MTSPLIFPLSDVADISSGITLGRKTKESELTEVPYLRVANVQDGHLLLGDLKMIAATRREAEKWALKDGDLLLTEGGDLDKLGRGACWREQLPLCIHQNHIFRVRLPADRYDADFVSFQIGSPYGKAYFLAHAKKTTGIASINQRVLGAFPLVSPPIAEQHRIAVSSESPTGRSGYARAKRRRRSCEKWPVLLIASCSIASVSTPNDRHDLGSVLNEVKQGIGAAWAEYRVLGATRDGLAPAKEPPGKHAPKYKPAFPGTVFYNPMRISDRLDRLCR
jgi:type I restriction enzyme S subunit